MMEDVYYVAPSYPVYNNMPYLVQEQFENSPSFFAPPSDHHYETNNNAYYSDIMFQQQALMVSQQTQFAGYY